MVDNKRRKNEITTVNKEYIPYWYIFKKAMPQLINVALVFFVTLSLFPAVQANIQRSSNNFFIGPKHYLNIMCFLTFNLFAMIGSYCATWINWVRINFVIF